MSCSSRTNSCFACIPRTGSEQWKLQCRSQPCTRVTRCARSCATVGGCPETYMDRWYCGLAPSRSLPLSYRACGGASLGFHHGRQRPTKTCCQDFQVLAWPCRHWCHRFWICRFCWNQGEFDKSLPMFSSCTVTGLPEIMSILFRVASLGCCRQLTTLRGSLARGHIVAGARDGTASRIAPACCCTACS